MTLNFWQQVEGVLVFRAAVYNSLHLYGPGLLLAVAGYAVFGNQALVVAGLLWMGHVGFDRMRGYGLKATSGFSGTHLGRIGRI